jgi:DNA-binding NarL/FixJ family response regulator
MSSAIRVLLADDHTLFRAGIRSLLEKVADVEVVGEAGTGLEALRLIEDRQPDVVLMDILMPELNGLDTTARVKEKLPHVRVIILSMNAAEEYVLQALRVGADGYLLKNVSPMELELAVRAVGQGQKFLASAVSKHVIESYSTRVSGQGTSLERLTPRQREVLQLVAEGHSSKEIAAKLDLRVKTVEMHRAQLMAALDIHDVAGLVRYAIRVGLITSDN